MTGRVAPGTTPELSVVVPVYNEEGNAVPLATEIRDVLAAIGRTFEMIFVNDGSTDTTLDLLRRFLVQEPRLRIIALDGNFGEAAALSAGFQAARGRLVISLDGDGQNDPRDIPRLLETFERRGCRVITGWRRDRKEGFLLRVLPSRTANWLIARVSGVPVHDNGCGLKIYERAIVEKAALPRGMNRFLPAILGVSARDVVEVPVNDRRREHGQSNYGISRTFVVLRDLLALRLMIRNPTASEPIVAVVVVAALAAHVYGHRASAHGLTSLSAIVVIVGSLIWWNLRRFNRAQRDGVFRVRREYTAGVD